MSKKHFSASVLLLVIGITLFTPFPWNKVQSGQQEDYVGPQTEEEILRALYEKALDSAKSARIDQMLTKAYSRGSFSGQVLLAEKGKVLYNKCFGFSNIRARRDSICPESTFQLASLSKPFTATAVMLLYQQGKIDINKPVKEYLEDFPFEDITVTHLLQHRSGLKNYIYIADRYWPNKKQYLKNTDISPLFAKYARTLDFKPGTRFKYCNTNYAYLALLVEKVSGQPFERFFAENISEPLGMENTFLFDSRDPLMSDKKVVNGYSYSRRTGFYKRYPDYLDGVLGDKGLFSTAQDIYRFDQALYRSDFLADSIIELMFTPAEELTARHDNDYGLGFRIRQDTAGHRIVFHNGWWKGFRTYFIHDYQCERTVIWLNNRSDVTINPYISKIFEIVDTSQLHFPAPEPMIAKDERFMSDSVTQQIADETYGSQEQE
ncbi:MAG: beta-lactamase family protein [Bacteroides sp.]|nr:beta-lactamase family protein [Ruminococcus flavefaciens]MCM1554218.1 beta-lactamase family protein [Bacteroides sp.]